MVDAIDHRRAGRDQVKVIFSAQAFLNDFKMQQAKEAAAEAEAQRALSFHFKAERRIVQPQLAICFRSFSKSAASTGNKPQNTTGCTSL
jgi:hypothetical protein